MNILQIEGYTRTIGVSQGYIGLPLKDSLAFQRLIHQLDLESLAEIDKEMLPSFTNDWKQGKRAMQRWFIGKLKAMCMAAFPAYKAGVIDDSVTGPGTPIMESLWEPTPEERALIANGANIKMMIVGKSHPPVMLSIHETQET